jgi:hypothetical protein
MTPPKLETKSYHDLCNGYLIFNPVASGLELSKFNQFGNYSKRQSVGLTTYLLEHFEIEENAFLSDDVNWGYIHNVLFSVIGIYNNPYAYDECWYHIRIEAMK